MMKQAMILAGGRGSRLRHMTDFVPKALLPIGGKPVLDSILGNLKDAGIKDVVIAVDYLKEQVQDFVKSNDNFGLKIRFVDTYQQDGKNGMAIGVYKLRDYADDNFLLCASDTIFPTDYIKGLMEFHEKNGNHATLSISELWNKHYLVGKSVVGMKENSDITKIIEKPDAKEVFSKTVSTPMYAFNYLLFHYIPRIGRSKRGEYELQSAIQMMIDDGKKVQGYMNEEWNDIGNWKMLNDCYDFLRLNFPYLENRLEPR